MQIAAARGQEAEALAAYRLAVLRATEDVENAIAAPVKREAQVGILTQGESSFARAPGELGCSLQGRRQPDRGWMPTAICCRCAMRRRRRKPKRRVPPLPPSARWEADGMRDMQAPPLPPCPADEPKPEFP
jgi:hypothetical protein